MDSDVPSECCVCGVPIGVKGGVGGSLQSTSGLWVCFRRKCWKQHEAVFCPDNERLMAIVNRRRDAESDARMAAHLYADALEHAMKADAERDAATARADKAEALLREARRWLAALLKVGADKPAVDALLARIDAQLAAKGQTAPTTAEPKNPAPAAASGAGRTEQKEP